MPWAGFGRLVASVAPPLAIGTVQLADDERVKGFLCESFAEPAALDITDFGGWRAYCCTPPNQFLRPLGSPRRRLTPVQSPNLLKRKDPHFMRQLHFSSALVLGLALAGSGLFGCGKGNDSAAGGTPSPAATGDKVLHIGFIYVGPKDDYGYNQAHADGAAAVAKMDGVKIVEEENVAGDPRRTEDAWRE